MKPCCETSAPKRKLSANALLGLLAFVLVSIAFVSTNAFGAQKKETVKVWGNCGMCKKTIEKSLKGVEGIETATWDKSTKILSVSYDDSKITMKKIEEKVASAGYDTQNVRANDAAYDNLAKCCHYDRKK
ncbi:MAG: cation transporter [Candidatus Kapabacteria bacterium]|jgi:copper chaperone CopZ|nr:cation transporter [Candidatus Kapabacteria bacterium]